MTTPILTRNPSSSMTVLSDTPQVIDLGIVKDQDGAAIDISSGWVAGFAIQRSPSNSARSTQTGDGTFTYGGDGQLNLSLTRADAAKYWGGSWPCLIQLTNDSWASSSVYFQGTCRVV